MPIERLLQGRAFGPDEIKVLSSAFEAALIQLNLTDRTDPRAQAVAKRIIELAQQGERDPVRLREGGVKAAADPCCVLTPRMPGHGLAAFTQPF